jgi:hypothetical protein
LSIRLAAAAAATLGLAVTAPSALAGFHEYCFWNGTYSANAANVLCFQSGDNYLTDNHAFLPYRPVSPTIFCGAHKNGVQYGGYVGGNPSCDHLYGGGNLLKADEYVDISATTHADITW